MTKKKLKGYVAFALFLAVIFVGTLYGPPHGWLLKLLALVIAVPFGILGTVAILEADEDDRRT